MSANKKNPTYAERQQRKAEIYREATNALIKGDLELVKKHFAKGRYDLGMSRNDVWANRTHEFAYAASSGQINVIAFFLEQGGNVNNQCGHLLSQAAMNGQIEMIDYLIKKGASTFSINSALSDSASRGNQKAVEHLLSKKADVSFRNNETLRMAAQFGHVAIFKVLVEHGADLHANDDEALRLAADREHNELTKTIIVDLKMPIKDETRQWLSENNGSYALELLEKRELQERLSQKYAERPRRPIKQSTGPTWKI